MRCDTFGYLQRSFLGVISKQDATEARDVGETAVHFTQRGLGSGSVAIRRIGDYSIDYFLTSLASVAAGTKLLPREYLKGDNNIADGYKDYARPLVGQIPQFRPPHRASRGAGRNSFSSIRGGGNTADSLPSRLMGRGRLAP